MRSYSSPQLIRANFGAVWFEIYWICSVDPLASWSPIFSKLARSLSRIYEPFKTPRQAAKTAAAVGEKIMHEQITHAIYYFGVHLVYSSIVWCAACLVTSIPGGSATTKHWIWLVTAFNFMLPLGAVIDALWAPYISWATPLSGIGDMGVAISENAPIAAVLSVIWCIGATLML